MLFLEPESKETHLKGVFLALKTSDISLAIIHLIQSLRIKWDADEDRLLGDLILQKGLLNIQIGGVDSLTDVLKTKGDFKNRPKEFYEAVAYLVGNRKTDAIKVIDKMIANNPNNIEAYILKAKTFWSQEKIIEGNDFMWKAFLINPEHTEVVEFLKQIKPKINITIDDASLCVASGRYSEALSHLKKGYHYLLS